MTDIYYPKVLLINSEPLNKTSATGITLSNLFKHWPLDKIAQIYTAGIVPDSGSCINNYKLSNIDLIIINKLTKRNTQKGAVSSIHHTSNYNKPSKIRKHLIPWVDLLPYNISSDLLDWINDFKPDVIYSLLGNIRLINLVSRLSRACKVPVVPHFMDDWLSTYSVHGRSLLTTLQRLLANKATSDLLKMQSTVGLAICDAMADEYSKRFEMSFESFMNPVVIHPNVFSMHSHSDALRLVYIGGLHLSRYANLIDIGHVVSKLKDSGYNIELNVYAPVHDITEYGEMLRSTGGINVRGTLSPDDVSRTLLDNDIAVHVESFLPVHANYTKLSLSTKIPQYFAAGLPVFAYGPSWLASCAYIDQTRSGIVVGTKNREELYTALLDLLRNKELRALYAENAFNVAVEKHGDLNVRDRFRHVLQQAAKSNSAI